ncbi:MAG: alpha-L-fucosidase [Puniceicoccales bacterium]
MEQTNGSALPVSASPGLDWFHQARLGMFVHYGLYSMLGRGEWVMLWEKIPPTTYNQLAEKFDASAFDAEALVNVAKRAGAGYVVFGARHHDGFCLWDTDTTEFNTVRTAAGRDLVKEVVEECRRAGLRVGIYHSVMSWQWPEIHLPPSESPERWALMVQETHDQVRELLTHYGQVDYLWYDGCVVPGLGDAGIRARVWRASELHAMARELQPGILINDRAATPEDVSTPEQSVTPPDAGRAWEACMTVGDHWGWCPDDHNLKSGSELISHLIRCAQFGGNFLLNISPRGDGSLPESQVERFDEMGAWMAVNGEAIRGSVRNPYTEADHLIGVATSSGSFLYFHLDHKALSEELRIAGIRDSISSVRVLGAPSACSCSFEQFPDGTADIRVSEKKEILSSSGPYVLAVEVCGDRSHPAPPSLLVERDTGRHGVPEVSLQRQEPGQGTMASKQFLECCAPAVGMYDLEFSVRAEVPTALSLSIEGGDRKALLFVECARYPLKLTLPGLELSEGVHRIRLEADRGEFELECWRLQPRWQVLGSEVWETAGPFPILFDPASGTDDQVKRVMEKTLPIERAKTSENGDFPGVGGCSVRWRNHPSQASEIVNLGARSEVEAPGLAYARTVLNSPMDCEVEILVGCDWWCNVYANGCRVPSSREPSLIERDGAQFNGWKPQIARLPLHQGENVILVKCHPGSTDNWFTFRVNEGLFRGEFDTFSRS